MTQDTATQEAVRHAGCCLHFVCWLLLCGLAGKTLPRLCVVLLWGCTHHMDFKNPRWYQSVPMTKRCQYKPPSDTLPPDSYSDSLLL
eukprot:1157977-Pelagomonas_calceolata.AAC.4